MRLPDGFLDELRARTPLAAVIGRRVKLTRSGRNWKGCCPFHNEKTPSFQVYEDGYKCFGCGAYGDAVGFVMQSQGLQFLEAVELLAGEAGLDVPKPTQAAVEAEQRRLGLHDILAAAGASYQRRLHSAEGSAARDYLRNRGLLDDTIARFGLGWSGEGRGALAAELKRSGTTVPQLIEAGLMREAEDGRPPYDLFFNRVMFPIRDRRGRIISFGGRTLGDGQPKYVNGPETPLFSKRRTLYGLDLAREAATRGAEIMAVEGYMDVIALHQAGFAGAVAPLGTALTEDQLTELWRLSPMPILSFDGDAAGRRAALRVAELALPQLTPARSLRVLHLPPGEDPDTLVRREGEHAFAKRLEAASPFSSALFDLMAEGVGQTPEARAGLRTRLETAAASIADKPLASEMRRALLDRFFESRAKPQRATAPSRPGAPRRFPATAWQKPPPAFTRPTLDPAAADHTPGHAAGERARTLVAILLRHPSLLPDIEEAFAALTLPTQLSELRTAMLQWSVAANDLDSSGLITHLKCLGLDTYVAQALSATPVPLPFCASELAMPAEVEAGWWHFFGLMNPDRLENEVEAARQAFAGTDDEAAQRRLIALCSARDALRAGRVGWDEPSADDHL